MKESKENNLQKIETGINKLSQAVIEYIDSRKNQDSHWILLENKEKN
jgi:hypothetical protein